MLLDNGAGVRLLGFCEPSKFNFCWWDPAGDPIDAPMHIGLQSNSQRSPYSYAIEVRGSTTEPETPLAPAMGEQGDADWKLSVMGLRTLHQIEAIVGVGPWKQVGELNFDKPLTVDSVTYKMTTPGGDWLNLVTLHRSLSSDDLMTVTVVSIDGKEIRPVWTDCGGEEGDMDFSDPRRSKVKTFHLWLRKGHVVTFANFALSPNVRPPITVTRDEVLAATKNPQPVR